MMIVPCIVLAAVGAMAVKATPFDEQNEQAIEDYLNSGHLLYEVGAPTMSYKDFRSRLMDPKLDSEQDNNSLRKAPARLMAQDDDNDTLDIPESFDARKKWPECQSIKLVRNQGNCGSCWAVSAASVMSDRLCIASGGKIQTILSSTDIISCCNECPALPCNGVGLHDAFLPWKYMKSNGICSGGPYGGENVCKPYVFYPCVSPKEIDQYGPCNYNETSPKPMCEKRCKRGYGKSYKDDKVYGDYRKIDEFDNMAIQKEIMDNGPVQSTIVMYDKFREFQGRGIYHHKQDFLNMKGYHAVKIIGWGVEEREAKDKKFKVKYWLISNSWGSDWGEGGFFRIVREMVSNGCEIERHVYAGYPILQ
ncbi:unnamed protein product [Cylicocyclus nassatus]|uniref:Peptidase C1A papain C-terminal domain-containing protein n=1 Tax=Cylicocyclus nassatus TaxID=53992 RepID=A0AA36M1N4_CYLNA|nr:unnamed protein product [Cylicocyclus nassatus]